jgi:hypothetical protein
VHSSTAKVPGLPTGKIGSSESSSKSFRSSSQLSMLRGDFEMLYSEALDGRPKVSVSLSSLLTIRDDDHRPALSSHRSTGSVARPQKVRRAPSAWIGTEDIRFMEYIQAKPDVWVTTRADIARHWRMQFPYEKPQRLVNVGSG